MAFITACLYLTEADLRDKANELGLNGSELTKEQLNGLKIHLRGIAQAWADAELQDMQADDFKYYCSSQYIKDISPDSD